MVGDISFLTLYKETCQHFKDLHNSVNQYFLIVLQYIKESRMLVKGSLKVHNRPMDFSIRGIQKAH